MSSIERGVQPEIQANRNLTLLNNFKMPDGRRQLEYARPQLEHVFKSHPDVVYVGWAANNMEAKMNVVPERLRDMGAKTITALHNYRGADMRKVLEDAGSVYVDGGNTYRLMANMKALRHKDTGELVDPRVGANDGEPLVETMQQLAINRNPLIGLSAGSIGFCSDIRIAFDPTSSVQREQDGSRLVHVDGMKLIGDPMNFLPHYVDPMDKLITDEQLAEILKAYPQLAETMDNVQAAADNIGHALSLDPTRLFVAVKDLSYLVINGTEMVLKGETSAVVFKANQEPEEIKAGSNLNHLLQAA